MLTKREASKRTAAGVTWAARGSDSDWLGTWLLLQLGCNVCDVATRGQCASSAMGTRG